MLAPREDRGLEPVRQHLIADAVLTWFPIDGLEIDEDYQRRLREKKVKDIVDDLKPDAIFVFAVHYRPSGRYIVVDGQHRLFALRQAGFTGLVPCLIYSNRTIEWEASTFPDLNRERTNLTPFEVIKAEERAGTPLYLKVMRAIEGAQFSLSPERTHEIGPFRVNCPALLLRIAEESSPDMIRDILLVIRDSWQETVDGEIKIDRDASRAEIVEGLYLFLHRYGLVMERSRLTEQLRRVSPAKLIRDAENLKATKRGSIAVNVARQIVERYNRGLRNRLPEWSSGKVGKDGE